MLEKIPSAQELETLMGAKRLAVWNQLCELIDSRYEMERLWNSGGKAWTYEYKYKRGGKTLCALYAKEQCFGFMLILGTAEREKFEVQRQLFSDKTQAIYDGAQTYHDGKWIMFLPEDTDQFADFLKLLSIKRKPNKL